MPVADMTSTMNLLTFITVVLSIVTSSVESKPQQPIMLEKSGGFTIGGKIITSPRNPNMTLSCDHGYMEYFIPWRPRKTSIVMWHSSSTQPFQNRWDGGEGFKDMFLRRNYPVYLWDAPRLGRANYACEPTSYTPEYRDQGNFAAWNFGPRWPQWWDDAQFPKDDPDAWHQATSARYVEYDTNDNVELQSDAAAVAADSGKLGTDIVFLTNSAAGLRAMLAATKAKSNNIKGIVMYEVISYGVFPDNLNITTKPGGFGPFVVPLEKFKNLAELSVVQSIWGDHRPENYTFVRQSRLVSALINQYGGNAQVLKLREDAGLSGNTHIAYADLNNREIAGLLDDLLASNGLDNYKDGDQGDYDSST
jgi:hypothetical protein